MGETKIEWTDRSYNPWVGCTKVSPGCTNCYAERMAKRLKAIGVPQYQDVVDENGWTGQVRPAPWPPKFPGAKAKPKMIFVGSMTDIFHEQVPFDAIKNLLCYILASNGRNIFQILTKRPERMAEFFSEHFNNNINGCPNPKFWLGVSVSNQEEADEKIPILLQIPAAVRFVSVEPMLGPVAFCSYDFDKAGIDWVICGAETGPGARLMDREWAYDLGAQVIDAGIPFFFKKDSNGNHELDGQLWEQFPQQIKEVTK